MKKYIKAVKVSRSPVLREVAKKKIKWRIDKSKVHLYRYQCCLAMMMREILALNDHNVDEIMNKYNCMILDDTVGLLFPKGFDQKSLPEKFRI